MIAQIRRRTYSTFVTFVFLLLILSGCKTPRVSRASFISRLAQTTVLVKVSCPSGKGSQGSGVIVSPDGYVLTAFHVVESVVREEGCVITLGQSKRLNNPPTHLYVARLGMYDAPMDVATLHVVGDKSGQPLTHALPAATLAESTPLIGETIHILGYPSLTENLLAYDHDTIIAEGKCDTPETCWLLTEAFASWGSSGGPAFNDRGELIGLATGDKSMTWKGRTHRLTAVRPLPPLRPFLAKALTPPSPAENTSSPSGEAEEHLLRVLQVRVVGPLGVNWRREPSTAKGRQTIIRVLKKGEHLNVILPGQQRGWWATADDRGRMGWVKERTNQLTLVEPHMTEMPSPLAEGKKAVVTCLTDSPCIALAYTPGYQGNDAEDILAYLSGGTQVTVVEPGVWVEDTLWWHVRTEAADGWMPEVTKEGYRLLSPTGP